MFYLVSLSFLVIQHFDQRWLILSLNINVFLLDERFDLGLHDFTKGEGFKLGMMILFLLDVYVLIGI